jgi:hypothetical protein
LGTMAPAISNTSFVLSYSGATVVSQCGVTVV